MKQFIVQGKKIEFQSQMKRNGEKDAVQRLNGEASDDATISDGFHTFEELYDHRITLFITLARISRRQELRIGTVTRQPFVWRSKRHSDGELCFGTGTQYVLGIGSFEGQQMTYHIPVERWEETDFAETLEKAPEFDGHTSADVLSRLKSL